MISRRGLFGVLVGMAAAAAAAARAYAPAASARLVNLIDTGSEHTSLEACKHVLLVGKGPLWPWAGHTVALMDMHGPLGTGHVDCNGNLVWDKA